MRGGDTQLERWYLNGQSRQMPEGHGRVVVARVGTAVRGVPAFLVVVRDHCHGRERLGASEWVTTPMLREVAHQ